MRILSKKLIAIGFSGAFLLPVAVGASGEDDAKTQQVAAALKAFCEAQIHAAEIDELYKIVEIAAKTLQIGRLSGDRLFDDAETSRLRAETLKNDAWSRRESARAAFVNAAGTSPWDVGLTNLRDRAEITAPIPAASPSAKTSSSRKAAADGDKTALGDRLAQTMKTVENARKKVDDATAADAAARTAQTILENLVQSAQRDKNGTDEKEGLKGIAAANQLQTITGKALTDAQKEFKEAEKVRDDAILFLKNTDSKTTPDPPSDPTTLRDVPGGRSVVRQAAFAQDETQVPAGPEPLAAPSEPVMYDAQSVLPPALTSPVTIPLAPVIAAPAPLLGVRELPLDDAGAGWVLGQRGTRTDEVAPPGQASLENGDNPLALGATVATRATPGVATRAFAFDGPAHFPLTRFRDIAQGDDGEGMTIGEGMVVRIAEDGSYEVDFRVTSLDIPTTIQLQFDVDLHDPRGPKHGTVTLPPIALKPTDPIDTGELFQGWHIIHRGSAPFIRLAFARKDIPVNLSRKGVTRFGSGVKPAISVPR